MNDTITLRSSSLHRVRDCPASAEPVELHIEGPREFAALGSAEHEAWQERVTQFQYPDLERIAARWCVDVEELENRHRSTWAAWERVAEYFPDPMFEVPLEWSSEDILLSGHLDLLSVPNPKRPLILDLKSGHGDYDHRDQLRAYAWLVMQNYGVDEVFAAVLRPRHLSKGMEGWLWIAEELEDWWVQFQDEFTANRGVYRPGPACKYCPRGPTCASKTQMLSQVSQILLSDEEFLRGCMSLAHPSRYGRVLDGLSMLQSAIEQARSIIKAEVQTAGSIPQEDGRELVIKQEPRETIRYTPSSQRILMDDGFVADDWEQIAKLSKTEIKKLAMSKAPRGQKGKAFDALMEKLRAAQACDVTFIEKLELIQREERTHERTAIPDHVTGAPILGDPS